MDSPQDRHYLKQCEIKKTNAIACERNTPNKSSDPFKNWHLSIDLSLNYWFNLKFIVKTSTSTVALKLQLLSNRHQNGQPMRGEPLRPNPKKVCQNTNLVSTSA